MKAEAWIFGIATGFFVLVSPAYWFVTGDWTGTSALTMTTLLGAMVTLYLGFHTTFLVQHWLGVEGMPRRYADYLPEDGFTFLNQVSTVGAFLLAASTLPFLYNVFISRRSAPVEVDDPWGWGRSLEWATSSPPPRHNFVAIPRIRSESPAFDLHHPEIAILEMEHNDAEGTERASDTPETEGREAMLRDRMDDEGETR